MGDMADDLRHWEIMEEIKRDDYAMGNCFFTARPTAEKKYIGLLLEQTDAMAKR